ncbi:hypothetical protein, partial [uncultured Bacteroides sp.]
VTGEGLAGAGESHHPSGQELKADTSINTYARVSAPTSLTSLTSLTPVNERAVQGNQRSYRELE